MLCNLHELQLPFFVSAPCVMARLNDSNIECEPNGNFRALQCSPVTDDAGSGAEESTRRMRSRTRRSREQLSCRCVYPGNGTTVEGSQLLLREGEKRPNCDRGERIHVLSVRLR